MARSPPPNRKALRDGGGAIHASITEPSPERAQPSLRDQLELDTTILLTALVSLVVRDRVVGTGAVSVDTTGIDALGDHVGLDRVRARLGQIDVGLAFADVVCEARD